MFFTLASAVNGGAHKISEPIDEASLTYFLQMGGSLDDLCGDIGPQSNLTSSCEVCNLVSAAILQDCEDAPHLTGYVRLSLGIPHEQIPASRPTGRTNSNRALPLV